MIETLLTSCQGGPEVKDLTFTKLEKKWVTLLCCLHKLDATRAHSIVPPKEVMNTIFMYCLPNPKELIDHIPLRVLPKLKGMLDARYQNLLIRALTERHANQIKSILKAKVLLKKTNRTPMQMAQARGHTDAAALLNPKVVPALEKTMLNNYKEFLQGK